MTDTEIIKALECCSSTDSYCSACPYCGEPRTCVVKKSKDALDLINRLKADNERLNGNLKFVRETVERQKAEIERLKEKDDNWATSYANAVARAVEAKSEARKEFAERLKEELIVSCDRVCEESGLSIYGVITGYPIDDVEECIDNLLKEMG